MYHMFVSRSYAASRVLRSRLWFVSRSVQSSRVSVQQFRFMSSERDKSPSSSAGKRIEPQFGRPALTQIEGILNFTGDTYGGVIVDSTALPPKVNDFEEILERSLLFWKNQHKRGIWLKIPIELVDLVPSAVKHGFVYHHAEKGYVMLTHWLSEEENRMPANASHQVGVGCVVVNDKGKMLLVQEKSGPLRGTGIWKMPTGLSDAGEDISDAATREVMEETGISCDFISILAIRQNHGVLFGKSDLFFICLLEPKSEEITMQTAEIAACDWVDPDVYFAQEFFKRSPLFMTVHKQIQTAIHAMIAGYDDRTATGSFATSPPVPSLVRTTLDIGFRPGKNTLYHFPIEEYISKKLENK